MKKESMEKITTDEEILAAINKLKNGKASDNNGIRAEDIKNCDAATKEKMKQIFYEVLKQEAVLQKHGAEYG